MPVIAESAAALRLFGDSLIPEAVTARIGAMPTSAYCKDDMELRRDARDLVRKTGMWILEAPRKEPEDLNAQVAEILSLLTQDIAVWKALAQEFEINLYCGLFMSNSNEGLSLSVSMLAALASRGIALSMDGYGASSEIAPNDPCPCRSGKCYGKCCDSPREACWKP